MYTYRKCILPDGTFLYQDAPITRKHPNMGGAMPVAIAMDGGACFRKAFRSTVFMQDVKVLLCGGRSR